METHRQRDNQAAATWCHRERFGRCPRHRTPRWRISRQARGPAPTVRPRYPGTSSGIVGSNRRIILYQVVALSSRWDRLRRSANNDGKLEKWTKSRGWVFTPGMSNPRPVTLSRAVLQRFYILTFENFTCIFRRLLSSTSINQCFISVIFYTRFILLIKRSFEFVVQCLYYHKFLTCGPHNTFKFVAGRF